MSNYAIVTDKLTKRFGQKLAVDNVNMHIPEGSIYGFVGENGSGKTTIMRLLMNLANPTKGTYSIYGINQKDPALYKIRNKVSAIIEAPSLVPTMTAYQNLKYACLYYGIKDYKAVINEVLTTVSLTDTGSKKVKNFSLGMRQRLGIALLLLNKPTLLLLDEPMNGLDPTGVADLRDLIIELNKKGITVLISSHILSELEKVATHWGFISHGKLLKEVSSEDLILECKKSIELACSDLNKLEEGLKAIGIKETKRYPTNVRVFDEITPIDLLNKLHAKGIEVTHINTIDMNVEEYYLDLIGGGQHA